MRLALGCGATSVASAVVCASAVASVIPISTKCTPDLALQAAVTNADQGSCPGGEVAQDTIIVPKNTAGVFEAPIEVGAPTLIRVSEGLVDPDLAGLVGQGRFQIKRMTQRPGGNTNVGADGARDEVYIVERVEGGGFIYNNGRYIGNPPSCQDPDEDYIKFDDEPSGECGKSASHDDLVLWTGNMQLGEMVLVTLFVGEQDNELYNSVILPVLEGLSVVGCYVAGTTVTSGNGEVVAAVCGELANAIFDNPNPADSCLVDSIALAAGSAIDVRDILACEGQRLEDALSSEIEPLLFGMGSTVDADVLSWITDEGDQVIAGLSCAILMRTEGPHLEGCVAVYPGTSIESVVMVPGAGEEIGDLYVDGHGGGSNYSMQVRVDGVSPR